MSGEQEGTMTSHHVKKRAGFQISRDLNLFTGITPEGKAVAWFEQNGRPVTLSGDQPQNFLADTRYQAQCRALQWLSDRGLTQLHSPA